MSYGSVKTTPRVVEPRVGRQSNPSPMLATRPPPPSEGRWLLYQLPDWIHDDNVKACLSCGTKFTLWNRRHHCRACGGIYCSECAKESWSLPQFNVHTPERLCNTCVNTQSVIFDLHAKLTTTRNGLEAHNARYSRLMQYAQTLQVGAMFNCFIDGSMRPRKLALSDDLLMIALINTRTNKVTNAYEILQISVSVGAHDDAKEVIGNSQLCFTMACHDQIFTLQALNGDLFQYWIDGIHLAQEMVQHKERVHEFELAQDDTSAKLHAAIQSQIHFAYPKVFPEEEQSSVLTLVDETTDPATQAANLADDDSDEEARKSRSRLSASGQHSTTDASTSNSAATGGIDVANSDPNSESIPLASSASAATITSTPVDAPPAALKMGRSVPRQPGYMNADGVRSPVLSPVLSPVRSPVSPRGKLSPRPMSPIGSVLSDSESPVPSNARQSLASSISTPADSVRTTELPADDDASRGTMIVKDDSSSDPVSGPTSPRQLKLQNSSSNGQKSPRLDSSEVSSNINDDLSLSNDLSEGRESRDRTPDRLTERTDDSLLDDSKPSHSNQSQTNSDDEDDHPAVARHSRQTSTNRNPVPASIDAFSIVSGIASTSLVDSKLTLTFDSAPSTPQQSEKVSTSSTALTDSPSQPISFGQDTNPSNEPSHTTEAHNNDTTEPKSETQSESQENPPTLAVADANADTILSEPVANASD